MIRRLLALFLVVQLIPGFAWGQATSYAGRGGTIATTTSAGIVKPDGSTITVGTDGTIVAHAGGSAGINQLTGDITAGPGTGSQASLISGGAVTAAKMAAGAAAGNLGYTPANRAGDALSGTFTGTPTFSGNLTFSGVPLFTGLSSGTQIKCLGLDSGNNLVYNGVACGSGGSPGGSSGQVQYNSSGAFAGAPITVSGSNVAFGSGCSNNGVWVCNTSGLDIGIGVFRPDSTAGDAVGYAGHMLDASGTEVEVGRFVNHMVTNTHLAVEGDGGLAITRGGVTGQNQIQCHLGGCLSGDGSQTGIGSFLRSTPPLNGWVFAGPVQVNSGAIGGPGVSIGPNTSLDVPNLALTGDLSTQALGADQNNYAPTGITTTTVLPINPTVANVNITGLVGVAGQVLQIVNVSGSNTVTLKNQSASSTAANRFRLLNDVVLTSNTVVAIRYDVGLSRWTPFDNQVANASITYGKLQNGGANGLLLTNSGAAPTELTEIDGDCVKGVSGAWAAGACGGSGSAVSFVGVTAGSANTQTIASPTPSGFTLTDQYVVWFKAGFTNTAAMTLNVNSTGATAVDLNTSGGVTALTGGEVQAGNQYGAQYQSACTCYVLLNTPAGTLITNPSSALTAAQMVTGSWVDITSAAQTITLPAGSLVSANQAVPVSTQFAATLTPNGTDTINGSNASVPIPANITTFITHPSATAWVVSPLVTPVAAGGTGQTTYTDGQLPIGDSSTGGLDKATITAGSNVTVTNGHGSITISSTGGGGSGAQLAQQPGYSFLHFYPGLLAAVSNTKGGFTKVLQSTAVDSFSVTATAFTCSVNPAVTMYECGTDATCASPTTMASATVTTAGTTVSANPTSSAITAGDYVAWEISAGTCTSLDIGAVAQVHSNPGFCGPGQMAHMTPCNSGLTPIGG